MTLEEFKSSLTHTNPPGGLSPELKALWYDAKGDWENSHSIIQDMESKDAALIHAYLHRKEGDEWNAMYWYREAEMKPKDISLGDELDELILKHLK